MKIGDSQKVNVAKLRESAAGQKPAGAKEAQRVDETILSGIPEGDLTPHVREVLTALLTEVQQLRAELASARERVGELENLADRDPLLDMLNRRAFVRELERTLSMIDRYGVITCLVFIDVDILKTINDQYGHGAGDAALKTVADIVNANTRQTDLFGRLGGDEFGLLLTHTKKDEALEKLKSLSAMIADATVAYEETPFNVSISYGVVELNASSSVETLLKDAGAAMYQAKKSR